MEQCPRLVVVRGNAASGKTSIATELQRAWGPGVAVIGQDHFRRVVLREHDVPGADNIGLIAHTVRYCASIGLHVVLEGILLTEHYGPMLRELVAEHPGPTHVFYVDVPPEETMRRHLARPLGAVVPAEVFGEWYVDDDRLGVPGEVALDGAPPLEIVLAALREHLGPLEPQRERDPSRYL
ncbi:AAA family ATPase [Nocardioides sp.]|uniref:AAA family ATPase n=1 Tax=Nocardioides sp. TaxID=35761 RepID=UPI00286BC6A4|nr:AAA family ATPase [Nocardioides sp.]